MESLQMHLRPLVIVVALATSRLHAQMPDPGAEARAALASQGWRVGQWSGEGWIQMGPSQRFAFRQTEDVRLTAGGTSLLMLGQGKSQFNPNADSVTVLQAMAVLWHDAKSRALTMRTWVQSGDGGMTAVTIAGDTLTWSYDDARLGHVRYVSMRTAQGEWLERGESSRDGTAWTQFLEMRLARKVP
jgi:hypothetical protein